MSQENLGGGDAVIAEIRRLLANATAGPWHQGPHYRSDVESREGRVCECSGFQSPRAIANAALIAAAPRLLTACLSRLEAQAQVQALRAWQPIETAPKDEDWVLVLVKERIYPNGRPAFAYWHERSEKPGYWRECRGNAVIPTHWMPLPDPPTAALASSEPQEKQERTT
jgi:hypothetical protein